jgi:hypothetical protein
VTSTDFQLLVSSCNSCYISALDTWLLADLQAEAHLPESNFKVGVWEAKLTCACMNELEALLDDLSVLVMMGV